MPAPSKNPRPNYVIGMLSGTSRDGADLALVSFESDRPRLEASICLPYPESIANSLREMIDTGRRPDSGPLEALDQELGEFFASGVHQLLHEIGVDFRKIGAIGSHGQTVWHEPPESIQLGDPQLIADKTGITTVSDFRQADLEHDGEGAPLAPLLHRALFRPEQGQRCVLNLGGIANLTVLDANDSVSGFDTGPGNCLMDGWIRRNLGKPYDESGQWAAPGRVIRPLLMTLLEDPWFSRMPPKSTGVEYFNLHWLARHVDLETFAPEDIQATLAELTAQSVGGAIPDAVREVFVCGGGVHNRHLMNLIRTNRPDCRFESTAAQGVDPDAVEAILFAWLARERLADRAQDTTSITGATGPVLLGSVYHPE